jgi:transcriptional regulator with XRE-family HTH domain
VSDSVNLAEVGRRLKKLRGDVSQETAAGEAGVSQDMVSRCERGVAYPPPNYLFWIAARGFVTVDWILTGRNPDQYSKAVADVRKKYGPPILPADKALVDAYRKAPAETQQAIRLLLKLEKAKGD